MLSSAVCNAAALCFSEANSGNAAMLGGMAFWNNPNFSLVSKILFTLMFKRSSEILPSFTNSIKYFVKS